MLLSDDVISPQYDRLLGLGHTRPTPAFAPPAMIMYVSLWPKGGSERHELHDIVAESLKDNEDDQEVAADLKGQNADKPKDKDVAAALEDQKNGINDGFAAARKTYLERHQRFFEAVNRVLVALQARGSWLDEKHHAKFQWVNPPFGYPPEFEDQEWFRKFAPPTPHDPHRGSKRDSEQDFWWFPQLKEETVACTINWFPGAQPAARGLTEQMVKDATSASSDMCVRIRVQAEVHSEHINLALYMDLEGSPDVGARRAPFIRDIREAVAHFTGTAAARLNDLKVTENPVAGPPTQTEITFAKRLFDTVWERLFDDFGIEFSKAIEKEARVFNSHRGLVIASDGYEIGANIGDPGTIKSSRFGDPPQQQPGQKYVEPQKTDPRGREWVTEPLAVTKAHWNIIRCLGEAPEQREFIASKVYGRRALFFSPLGSAVQSADAPGQSVAHNAHNRFVVVTCGQPNRESCGRLVERLMSIISMKAMALRDWAIIADASEHSVVRGRQLDAIVEKWVDRKTKLSEELLTLENKLEPLKSGERDASKKEFRNWQSIWRRKMRPWRKKWRKWLEIWDLEDEITKTSFKLSRHMIESDNLLGRLMQEVNRIGQISSGGLPYRLFKARYYAQDCMRLVNSLEMEAMDGWMSLEQSFKRGLEGIFDTIKLMHDRINSLRDRIQLVTDMVQTGASFEQQRKTSENTDELRRISRHNEVLLLGIERNTYVKMLVQAVAIVGSVAGGYLVATMKQLGADLAFVFGVLLIQSILAVLMLRVIR